jgi:hypothetical protein
MGWHLVGSGKDHSMITEILLVFAFVLSVLGGFLGVPAAPAPWYGRFNLVSWALACFFLSLLLGGMHLPR